LLDEVLALVPSRKRVFLEIKGPASMLPELRRCIERSDLRAEQICLIAFSRKTLRAARALMPDVECAWIVKYRPGRSLRRAIARAVADGLQALDLSASWPLSPNRALQVHDAGLNLYIWTVDRVNKARHLAMFGVDGITTNHPQRIREAI
jgi:glycerophosphoryl diester phosphodiesterase